MKRSALAALAAVSLSLPTPAQADKEASSGSEIVVGAQQSMPRHGWLMTSGPNELGLYTASIYIGDLNPATPPGWSKMARRISLGTASLCDRAQALPRVAGFYNAEQRACWAETRGQAAIQMERARNEARGGRRIAYIGLGEG
jgi:hypothetical protein